MGCSSNLLSSKSVQLNHGIDMNIVNAPVLRRHPSYCQSSGYIFGNQIRTKIALRPTTFSATSRATDELVTIRQYPLINIKTFTEEDVIAEITIHSHLTHENIIKIREIYRLPESIFVITAYQEITRLQDCKFPLSLTAVKSILQSLCSAVGYCHSKGVIIRNIFPKVLMIKLISKDCHTVKLADFSCAVLHGSKAEFPINQVSWEAIKYTAPEAILNQPYSFSMDMWSIGVLAYEMTSGRPPFRGESGNELVTAIKSASYCFEEEEWQDKEPAIMKLIENLLVVDPSGRFNCKSVLSLDIFSVKK